MNFLLLVRLAFVCALNVYVYLVGGLKAFGKSHKLQFVHGIT